MQDRRAIAVVNSPGQKNHVGPQVVKLANLAIVQLESRRTDHLCARAERRLVRRFDGQSRYVADDRDPQPAGGAARRKNDFPFENRQVFRRPIKDTMALMQRGESRQQSFAHVGADRRRRLAAANQLRRIEIHGHELSEGTTKIDEQSESRHEN